MNVVARKEPRTSVSAEEMERRREALRRADAHNRIEGIHRERESDPIFEAYIRGEIDESELVPRLEALDRHK